MSTRNQKVLELYNILREELKMQELDVVTRGEAWKELMGLMADEFNSISASANSESDIATKMDAQILNLSSNVFEPSGLHKFELNKERGVTLKKDIADLEQESVHVIKTKGRIDSKYDSFVIEYKQPSTYKTTADTDKAMYQALDYLNALYEEELGNYLACVTDGSKCQFVAFNKQIKGTYDNDKYSVAPLTTVRKLNADMANRIFKGIIDLQVKALTAENLIKDLVLDKLNGKNKIQHLTSALYDSLTEMNSLTSLAYGQWMTNFGLSHDDLSKQKAIQDRRRDLAELIDREKIETDEEYKILFSLQTSIAILAVLIAYRVVLLVKGNATDSFRNLVDIGMDERRIELSKIAEGTASFDLNIFNLLEVGCFSWPFQKKYWTEETNNCVKDIIETLMVYETMPDLTDKTDDLFRDLYIAIMPVSVRHSLGEYYTPDWLAEHVVYSGNQYLPMDKEHIRVLDSTAGSGTFPQKVIEIKRNKYTENGDSKKDILKNILNEVVAIDANTIAVILARINYFLAIADLIERDDLIYIPVYIGDSSIPNSYKISDDGHYYVDSIQLQDGEMLKVKIPVEATDNLKNLITTIQNLSLFDKEDSNGVRKQLDKICSNEVELEEISSTWINMNSKGLITPAITNSLLNSFLLSNIGKFDLVVGNPPWVDWKTLPSVHRENKKEICYERNLFSGDGRTGGNSLNICALISNVTAENWLNHNGVMAILMPQSLLFQQSYEGYREFDILGGRKLYFQEIIDWAKSGHPFSPVQQLFCTYIISEKKQDYSKGIPLKQVILKKGNKLERIKNKITYKTFNDYFSIVDGVVGKASVSRSAFTYAKNQLELSDFNVIAGTTKYVGREGVEYYPQELQLLRPVDIHHNEKLVTLENYQSSKSKISVGKQTPVLETTYLRPLVKGVNISRFHIDESGFVVAFPYDETHNQVPLSVGELIEQSPRLMKYYATNKDYLTSQTAYSDKIIGRKNAEYYALARTGKYCHADWYVVFRDNTKWVAAVTGRINTEWGENKIPAFQNHCVSICEGPNGEFITEDEAHYICAILNSHIVENYILSTSDKRTFKIRIPVKIVPFDSNDKNHIELVKLSKKAHQVYNDSKEIEQIRNQTDICYRKTLE